MYACFLQLHHFGLNKIRITTVLTRKATQHAQLFPVSVSGRANIEIPLSGVDWDLGRRGWWIDSDQNGWGFSKVTRGSQNLRARCSSFYNPPQPHRSSARITWVVRPGTPPGAQPMCLSLAVLTRTSCTNIAWITETTKRSVSSYVMTFHKNVDCRDWIWHRQFFLLHIEERECNKDSKGTTP